MNNTFKANLIKTLANKKGNKGFTLIELLVVVIIIGVLAAIALPNLLGQVGKARESEAKSQIGAINRAQQGYFTEYSNFAPDSTVLEVPVGNEKYYLITVEDDGATPPVGTGVTIAQGSETAAIKTAWDGAKAAGTADPAPVALATSQASNEKNGTRDYLGGVSYHVIDRSFATVVCRAENKAAKYSLDTASTDTLVTGTGSVGSTAGDGAAAGCDGTVTKELK